MNRLVATLDALGFLIRAMGIGLLEGTRHALPWLGTPRGARERHTIVAAERFSDRVLAALGHHARVTGAMPEGLDGALIVCNHRSWLDPVLLMGFTRSQGLAKALILWIPIIGFYGWLTGGVFFNRRSPRQRARAREEVLFLLKSGHRIHMFPEGTRTRTGALRDRVSLKLIRDCHAAGVPVVPCAVWATERTLPTTEIAVHRGGSSLLDIGAPMDPAAWPDPDAFAEAVWTDVRRRVDALGAEDAPFRDADRSAARQSS